MPRKENNRKENNRKENNRKENNRKENNRKGLGNVECQAKEKFHPQPLGLFMSM